MTATTKLPTGTHPSNRDRRVGFDEWEPVPCGDWYDGGRVLCDTHEEFYAQEYPQGWAHYPGDICVHGVYVGGCGIDWMCHYCEMGWTQFYDQPEWTMTATLMLSGHDFGTITKVSWDDQDSPHAVFVKLYRMARKMNQVLFAPPALEKYTIEFSVEQTREGYWDEPTWEEV